jgi:hypothetical protein
VGVMTAYDQLLDRFDGVRRNGNSTMARCPAHDDHTRLAALNLGWADLYDDPRGGRPDR